MVLNRNIVSDEFRFNISGVKYHFAFFVAQMRNKSVGDCVFALSLGNSVMP